MNAKDKVEQVHRAVIKLNETVTWEQLVDAEEVYVEDSGLLVLNGQRYKVLGYDFGTDTYTIRKINE